MNTSGKNLKDIQKQEKLYLENMAAQAAQC